MMHSGRLVAVALLLASLLSLVCPSPPPLLLPAHAATPLPSILRIGAVLPLSGPMAGVGYRAWVVLNTSIADLRSRLPASVLPSTQLQVVVADSAGTSAGTMRASLELYRQGIIGFIAGVCGGQNQNLTQLPRGRRLLGISRAVYEEDISSADDLGVSVGSRQLLLVSQAAHASPEQPPVVGTSHVSCAASVTSDALAHPHLFRLCTPSRSVVNALSVTFSEMDWQRFVLITLDTQTDGAGYNMRFTPEVFAQQELGLGERGGGGMLWGQSASLADALMREVYGSTVNSSNPTRNASWPYDPLRGVTRIRLPSVASELDAAVEAAIERVRVSQWKIVVVALSGHTLTTLLKRAFFVGLLQKPYVWVGIGAESIRGVGGSSVIHGEGTLASMGSGPGLCSTQQAAIMQQYKIDLLSARIASGELASSTPVSLSSTTLLPHLVADNSVTQFITNNPLSGVLCLAPAVPRSMAWIGLKYKFASGGRLPTSIEPDANDANLYETPALFAYALQAVADANQTLTGGTLAAAMRSVRFTGAGGSFAFNARRSGDRVSTLDLLNFDQLSDGSEAAFVPRATYDEASERVTYSDTVRWADGSTEVPADFTPRWLEGQRMNVRVLPSTVLLSLALLLLASFATACHLYQSKKYDCADPHRRWRHYRALCVAALIYASMIIVANLYLHEMLLEVESLQGEGLSLRFSLPIFISSLLVCFAISAVAMCVAGSQNGSHVSHFRNPHIARYEIAGKTGAAGGGGGSGVNFLSSESSGAGASSAVSGGASGTGLVHHLPAGPRVKATPYGSTRGKSSRSVHSRIVQSVPLWSRALEELYITGVLCFTSWRMLLSGLLLSCAWVSAYHGMVGTAVLPVSLTLDVHATAWIGAFVLVWLVQSYGLTILLRESRRMKLLWGVLWLSAMHVACFYTIQARTYFRYHQASVVLLGDVLPTNVLVLGRPADANLEVSADQLSLAFFIFVAACILDCLSQVIDILQLSRGTLDQILSDARDNLTRLEGTLVDARADTKAQGRYQEHVRRQLELINLTRPLHRNHALAFALADLSSSVAAGGKGRAAIIPPCFEQHDRPAGVNAPTGGLTSPAAGVGGHHKRTSSAGKSTLHTPAAAALSAGVVVLPGSRQPSEGLKSPSVADHLSGVSVSTTSGGTASASVSSSSLEDLDFSFLARAKSESAGLKLLQELSERLFLASGPVHHRAVQDIQLAHVLAHPVTLELFKDSLTRPASHSLLSAWLDVQRYRQLTTPDSRRAIAESMWSTFLSSSALYPLAAIPAATKDSLGRRLGSAGAASALPPTLFDALDVDLLYQLQKEMTAWSGSTAFKIAALVLGHSAYQPDARLLPLVVNRAARQQPTTQQGHTAQRADTLQGRGSTGTGSNTTAGAVGVGTLAGAGADGGTALARDASSLNAHAHSEYSTGMHSDVRPRASTAAGAHAASVHTAIASPPATHTRGVDLEAAAPVASVELVQLPTRADRADRPADEGDDDAGKAAAGQHAHLTLAITPSATSHSASGSPADTHTHEFPLQHTEA